MADPKTTIAPGADPEAYEKLFRKKMTDELNKKFGLDRPADREELKGSLLEQLYKMQEDVARSKNQSFSDILNSLPLDTLNSAADVGSAAAMCDNAAHSGAQAPAICSEVSKILKNPGNKEAVQEAIGAIHKNAEELRKKEGITEEQYGASINALTLGQHNAVGYALKPFAFPPKPPQPKQDGTFLGF